jgi:O-antigen/teichoic acid export membrane protein
MNDTLSLKARVFRAGSWTLFGYSVALVLRLLGNLIMARLLAPEAFGIMAMATTINVIVGLFSDIGLRQAIIQSKNGQNEEFLNTAWTVQIVRGAWIWVACLLIAGGLYFADRAGWVPTNNVYGNSILPAIIAVGSFSSVILGFQSMKLTIMSRRLELRRVTLIDLIQMTASYAVAIVMGWLTHSVWSFIVNGIVGSIVYTLLSHFWLSGHRDQLAWSRPALNEILRFGRWVFVSSIIGVLAMNGDRLLLGGWITAASLGFYSIASGLSSMVDGIAGRIFANVSLPALGEIARDRPERVPEVYTRMRWGADTLYIVVAGFLYATGQKIITILYDPRYLPAGDMLQLLSFGLLFSRYSLAQSAYVALGKPNYVAALNVAKVISLFALVPTMFYFFGIRGAILGVALYLLPTVPLIYWFNHKHGLNNFRLEVGVLAMWPLGWLAGEFVLSVLSWLQ